MFAGWVAPDLGLTQPNIPGDCSYYNPYFGNFNHYFDNFKPLGAIFVVA